MTAKLVFLAIMLSRRLPTVLGLVVLGGCYTPPDAPPAVRSRALETTQLVFQAVDAGTGSALSDAEMTVRYLVRTPIIFDATSVERVPSIEPVEISYEVAEERLVLEIRLEADSYFGLDTVLSVPRGGSVGPMTLRMSRRLGRVVQGGPGAPADVPGTTTGPTPNDPEDPPVEAGDDRTALRAGDRAFSRGSWLDATEAYQGMPAPTDEMNEYGRDYLAAKIQQGIAHINRSEYGRALEIFEETVSMAEPGPAAYLRLSQAQCAVGRSEEGRGTLAQLARARNRMTPAQQSNVSAMIAYRRGVCSHGEFERAETTRERVRFGAQATQQLNAFIEGATAMSPVPPQVYNAVQDSERRVAEIRRLIGGGG